MTECPHCRTVGEAERSAALRFRCRRCGGPVVPGEGAAPRSHGELACLVAAQRERAMAVGWKAALAVFGASALGALGLATVLFSAARAASLILAVVGAALCATSLVCRSRATTHDHAARARIDEAWRVVAREVGQSG